MKWHYWLTASSVVGLLFWISHPTQGQTTQAASGADLQAAGYTNVTQQSPQAGRFSSSAAYFRVSESVGQAETHNLVMVYQGTLSQPPATLFVYGPDSKNLSVPQAQAQEATGADGRTIINMLQGNVYTVIVAPVVQKAEALALRLAQR